MLLRGNLQQYYSQRSHRCCPLANNVENIDRRRIWTCLSVTPKVPFSVGDPGPTYCTYLGLESTAPNGISIGLSVFARLTLVTNRLIYRPRCMCNNKPHLTLCIAMWPKSILQLNIATSCCITDSESRIAAGTYRIRLRISTTRWIFPVRYSGPGDGLFPWGMWAPPTASWTHPSPHPKWHFDRFIQYTGHAVTSVTNK